MQPHPQWVPPGPSVLSQAGCCLHAEKWFLGGWLQSGSCYWLWSYGEKAVSRTQN